MTALKRCPQCEEWKEAAAFGPSNHSLDGLQSWCKACKRAKYLKNRKPKVARVKRSLKEKAKTERKKQHTDPTLKWCGRCQTWKERTPANWGNNKHYPDGLHVICRLCQRDYTRDWRRDNPGRRNEQDQRRKQRKAADRPTRPTPTPLVLQPELQQAITAFLNVKALKRPNTKTWYANVLHYYAAHLVEAGLPQWSSEADVWADNVNSFLASTQGRGCKDQTLDCYYRAVCAWLRWLKKRKRIGGDVIELIERPSKTRHLPKAIQPEDAARLLATLETAAILGEDWRDVRDYALMILALDTGARVGELAGLTLAQVDMSQQVISITCSKTNMARTVVFSDKAARWLQVWLEVRAGLGLPGKLDSLFVGCPKGGVAGRLTTNGMGYRLKIWQKRAGVARFNFNRLRHSYAVYTLRAKGELTDIQRQMGHTSISTTAIYLRVDDMGRQGRHNQANPLAYLLSQGGAL
jgi:integrase/recombinase XerC